MQQQLLCGAVAALLVAAISGLGERRRRRRRKLDDVGLVPWTTVQMVALVAAVVLGSLALNFPQ
ncbi:MAG: hypothetical protein J7500_17275 [Sphingomonas sp.]|nr:hypothetical protein [Sphingomonas sp.]